MKTIKMSGVIVMLVLMNFSTPALAHTVQQGFLAHDLAHLVYGFNHMPVVYATTLSGVLLMLAGVFTALAWRYARREWLAAGGISVIAAGTVLLVTF